MASVKIRVPATSANIGPGFDTLGCAFSLYNILTFTESDTTRILGCPVAYAGEDNLALVAFRAACRRAGRIAPPVTIHIETNVPVSRGLGSSATLLVGGATGANCLLSLGLAREDILAIATEIEGHPDNIAPAVYGGFTAAMMENGLPIASPCRLHPVFRFCALVPDCQSSTHEARTVLPKEIPFADAVFNGSRLAMTLAAFAAGDAALLARALDDRLHQPYRMHLIPAYAEMRAAALAAGAHAFFISGSGSTCMAVYTDPAFPDALAPAIAALPGHVRLLPLSVDTQGAVAI